MRPGFSLAVDACSRAVTSFATGHKPPAAAGDAATVRQTSCSPKSATTVLRMPLATSRIGPWAAAGFVDIDTAGWGTHLLGRRRNSS